jgi:hypothetical protein
MVHRFAELLVSKHDLVEPLRSEPTRCTAASLPKCGD